MGYLFDLEFKCKWTLNQTNKNSQLCLIELFESNLENLLAYWNNSEFLYNSWNYFI